MGLVAQLMFAIMRPLYAVLLAIGATIGVAASVVIMNLLVGYFAVASDAYTSIHPHLTMHGSWTEQEAADLADKLPSVDSVIERAAPALHFERDLTIASVEVRSELCLAQEAAEASCSGEADLRQAKRTYSYDVKDQQRAEVQVRGIVVAGNRTVADIGKLMAGESNLDRLMSRTDSGGNVLPAAFIAQDTLISEPTGTFLIAPEALGASYDRYWRLHGVIRLGAKSSGAPLVVMGLKDAMALAPPGLDRPNVIEVRLRAPLEAERVAARLRELYENVRVVSWIDRERPAFEFLNATWVMVFSVMLNICLVVAISIYSTMTLSIIRNRWKIGLLESLGCTPARLAAIFLAFALTIGLIGTLCGGLLGQLASRLIGGRLYETMLGLPPERFEATLTWAPAAWMAAATLLIFVISALIPVKRALSVNAAGVLSGHA